LNIQFEHIEYAWLFLLLIPIVFLWFWWDRKKAAVIKALANTPRLLQSLLSNYNPLENKFRLVLFTGAFAGILLSLMNPRVIQEEANIPMKGVQVMIAMDVSNSMLAADVAPNRFEKARSFAIKLTDALGGSRIGLLAFAGEARLQMPPTTDIGAIKQALQTLSYSSVPLQGTNMESALDEANRSLSNDVMSYKAVMLITDGEALEGAALERAVEYAREGMIIFVAGVGTQEGFLLVEPDSGMPISDDDGAQVLSKINEGLLSELATETGGKYYLLADINEAVLRFSSDLNRLDKIALPNNDLVNYSSLSPWILFAVLILLFAEWGRLFFKNIFLSKVKKVVPIIGVIFCTASFAYGQQAKKEISTGTQAYKEGNWEMAMDAFDRALQADPVNTKAKFYKALAAYKMERYTDAATAFSELAAALPEKEIQTASFNNTGLAYAQEGKLKEAIEVFKQAFRANPGDAEIKQNLQKALLDLKKQEQDEQKDKKKPPPPMKEDDANRKLQSVMDEERKTREKMKPRGARSASNKNW
jgi:tetratricopeptide (TPR) repeat protein